MLKSTSSDAEIVKFLSKVNKKITGYYSIDESVGEQFASRVEASLSYRKYEKGGEFGKYEEWELPLVEKRGKLQIDLKTKEGKALAVAHMRRVLKEQEEKDAPKTIEERLGSMPTATKKIKQVAKEMAESKSMMEIDGEPVKLKSKAEAGVGTRDYNAYVKTMAINEMIVRANTTYDTSFEDVINMLYEDEEANNDIISRLATEKWDGELMEAANVRVIGYEPEED